MEIELVPADPAQNYTLFVTSPVEKSRRSALSALLLERQDFPAEQVAFVTGWGPVPSMEMMGGEFCGNASRSFGMMAAARTGGLRRGKLQVAVSGASGPLWVDFDLDAGTSRVNMPLHRCIDLMAFHKGPVPVVVFDGIVHAIAEKAPDPALAEELLRHLEETYHCDAEGVIFLEQDPLRITPVVRVPATGSTVWEHSCGSGSLAAALWLAMRRPGEGMRHFSIQQPGGVLEIGLRLSQRSVTEAWLGGPVSLGQSHRLELEF